MKKIILTCLILNLIWGCTSDPLPNSYAPVPKVTTKAATHVTYTSVTLSISINSQNASKIGLYYSKNSTPNQRNSEIESTSYFSETSSFTLYNLDYGTKYYYRAFATNDIDTVYGEIKNFTTTNATIPIISTTTAVTSVTQTTAITGGNISSDGGFSVIARGVCWSTTSTPTINNSKTTNGTGIGSFVSSINGLKDGTIYYVSAYATNSIGTSYGSQITFTTIPIILPTITTATVTSITQTTATSGGNVTNDGGGAITARGVCWSTSTNPTISLITKTSNGTGLGAFTSSITGLLNNTIYYVRAYATNSTGTAYGTQINFATAPIIIPTITTSSAIPASQTTATCGGNITSDGGATITARGVCWDTSTNPTISLTTKTSDGTGLGAFTSSITGLLENATYYVRAYATNSAGTAYGTQVSFSTTVAIGQSYQGGIIAYILESGDSGYIAGQTHGLIAAPSDQSTGIRWWNGSYTFTGATATALGTGNGNTNTIIASQGNTGSYAAKLCSDLDLGGYTDWYLPSIDELYKLYLNKAIIGGFADYWYLSSSEFADNNYAVWGIRFDSANFLNGSADKAKPFYVRAVRTF